MELDLKSELRSYGATDENIRLLKEPEYSHIDYLDLIPNNRTNDASPDHVWLDAIVESLGQPLIYVVRSASLAEDLVVRSKQIKVMRRDLACRGDGAYFALIEPGTITVYPVSLSTETPPSYTYTKQDHERTFLVQDFAQGYLPEELSQRNSSANERAVHELLYDLLNQVTDELLHESFFKLKGEGHRDGRGEVLSLVGCAIFTRFLIDRGIVNKETFSSFNAPFEDCFSNADLAVKTCIWLDQNFNGELLSLANREYEKYFLELKRDCPNVFNILSKILYRSVNYQLSFDLYWNDINFAHVPVGLLSEVYERFSHRHFEEHADKESVHYTPYSVAEYMVNQSFPGIVSSSLDQAKILDPSAGAGVFLVLCLRRLVAERWKVTGRQPQTNEIRTILNNQISGLDINGYALKLAALSLYLTALELDPDPFPPEKLRFEPLLGKVLFNTRLPQEEFPHELPVLGSLGPGADERHINQYDLVIGNPPWTPWSGQGSDELNSKVSEIIREIAYKRDPVNLKSVAQGYKNARKVSDLPFMWRAMEWSKPDGIIAYAMSARILFSRNEAVAANRDALFTAVRITGILNGTALRRTKVWPTIKAPFCLIFAINRQAKEDDIFQFISPEIDSGCNENGRMRIDYTNAQPIQLSVLKMQPTILKTLFRGNGLDAKVMRSIEEVETVSIEAYLSQNKMIHGEGYQKSGSQNYVPDYYGKPYLSAKNSPKYFVEPNSINQRFKLKYLHRPRDRRIYKGPLLILRSTLRPNRDKGCGIYSADEILFNESFYGYSGHGNSHGDDLVRYLYVLSYSQMLYYTALVTSAKFGFEREVIYKEDFDQFPIIPLENLSKINIDQMRHISHKISEGMCPWKEVDDWVALIYKLTKSDQQVISDTLEVSMPFTESIKRSVAHPSKKEVDYFCKTLSEFLAPFFNITKQKVFVEKSAMYSKAWIFLDVYTSVALLNNSETELAELLKELADNEGASLIKAKIKDGHLLIGILAQYRYWTPTRCRLLSMNILRDSEEFFPLLVQ